MFSLSSWMKIRLKVSGVSSSSCKTSVRSSTLFRVTAPPAHGTATYFSRTPIGRARDGATNDLSNAVIGPARTPQRELELGGVDILDVLVRQRQDDRRDVLLKHGCVSRSDQTSSLRPPSFDWRWTGCASSSADPCSFRTLYRLRARRHCCAKGIAFQWLPVPPVVGPACLCAAVYLCTEVDMCGDIILYNCRDLRY